MRQVLSAIDRAKNQGITAASFQPGDYFDDVVAKAYKLYEERLAASNATDFGGLLIAALQCCLGDTPTAHQIAERFDHVLVDEFQDTNSVQYKLVRCLSNRTGSITVVGDEDQSIYKWRGADIRNILDFERDHAGARVVKLEQNYRSTGHILRAANAIIACNSERRPKRLFTEAGDGARIVLFEGETERDEAEFVAARIAASLQEGMSPRDFAVFYRTNAQSRVLEDAFRARNLPYVVVGGTRFFDRAEIKDLICYLRAIGNPDDGMALQRIINVPARGIGAATVDKISEVLYNGPPAPDANAEAARPARGAQAELPLAQRGARKMTAWSALELCANDESILGAGPRKKVAAFVDDDEQAARRGRGSGAGGAGREGPGRERLPRRAGRRVDHGGRGPHGEPARARRPDARVRARGGGAVAVGVPRADRAGVRRRRLRSGEGRRVADDGAHRQGARVPGRLHHRARGADLPARAQRRRRLRRRGGAPPVLRRGHARAHAASPVARAPPPPVGARACRHPQPLPARAARGDHRRDRHGAAARIRRAIRRHRGAGAVGRTLEPRRRPRISARRRAADVETFGVASRARAVGPARRARRAQRALRRRQRGRPERPAHRRQAAPRAVRRRRGARLAGGRRRHEGHRAFPHGGA